MEEFEKMAASELEADETPENGAPNGEAAEFTADPSVELEEDEAVAPERRQRAAEAKATRRATRMAARMTHTAEQRNKKRIEGTRMKSKVKSAAKAPAKAEFAKKRAAKAEKPGEENGGERCGKVRSSKATSEIREKPEKRPGSETRTESGGEAKSRKGGEIKTAGGEVAQEGKPEENVPAFGVWQGGRPGSNWRYDDGEGRTGHGREQGGRDGAGRAKQRGSFAFGKETRFSRRPDAILAAGPGMEGARRQ